MHDVRFSSQSKTLCFSDIKVRLRQITLDRPPVFIMDCGRLLSFGKEKRSGSYKGPWFDETFPFTPKNLFQRTSLFLKINHTRDSTPIYLCLYPRRTKTDRWESPNYRTSQPTSQGSYLIPRCRTSGIVTDPLCVTTNGILKDGEERFWGVTSEIGLT